MSLKPAARLAFTKASRAKDAARLLPVFALFLMILPLLWQREPLPSAPEPPSNTGAAQMLWIFGIWFGLILVAAALAPNLAPTASAGATVSSTVKGEARE